jgi:hypothetical protein
VYDRSSARYLAGPGSDVNVQQCCWIIDCNGTPKVTVVRCAVLRCGVFFCSSAALSAARLSVVCCAVLGFL